MVKKSKVGRVFSFLIFGCVLLLANTARAQFDCPSFPKLAFWGNLTHESILRHVEAKLFGDWSAYLNQLRKQQKALENIYARGSGAIVKRKGRKIKLSGAKLSNYIKFSKSRISVIQCLADEEDASNFANFSTAAGTPDATPVKKASKFPAPVKTDISRTYLRIPENLLTKLRKIAVRESLRNARKTTVSEVVVDILEKELKNKRR